MSGPSAYHQFICPVCEGERVVFIPEREAVAYCRCACGYTVLFSWCPKCGSGGPQPLAPTRQPAAVTCPLCRSPYAVPPTVYARPIPAAPAPARAGISATAAWFWQAAALLALILIVGYAVTRM